MVNVKTVPAKQLRRRRTLLPILGWFVGGILVLVSLTSLWVGFHVSEGPAATVRIVGLNENIASFVPVPQTTTVPPLQTTTAYNIPHRFDEAVVSQTTVSPVDWTSTSAAVSSVVSAAASVTSSASSSSEPVKIAHVISLITCQKANRVKGFLDALVVLRHSIHQNSVHAYDDFLDNNNNTTTTRKTKSKYSYQMYAVLHPDGGCLEHVDLLKRLGYIPLVKQTPVNISAITTNDWYKSHVEGENCCGASEFIKLYAYTLTDHPVSVHWDLDVAVLKPLDDLFDAIIYDKDSVEGREARLKLNVQNPASTVLPDRIDAFFTRDVTSSQPWERVQAVQGGFVVARPNMKTFTAYQDFIMEANYTPGRGSTSGWGGLGYGGFQGAMAYQGVLAYYYDIINPGHSVELDVCRWNQVVADVIWRGPNQMEHAGECRQFPVKDGDFANNRPENGKCEDCRVLPVEETHTVHYTACNKPWDCTVPYPRIPNAKNKKQTYRLQEKTNVTTCGLLHRKYFDFRKDIEDRIAKVTGRPPSQRDGTYFPEMFLGYCKRSTHYLSMDNLPADFDMKQVYGF